MTTGEGPDRIRSIAVHRDDVATALEATLRTEKRVVLRITPPFSGRMRARIHEVSGDAASAGDAATTSDPSEGDPSPIHVDPRALVEPVPPYPEVDETAAAYPDADVERRRERHAEAVADWRERVRTSLTDGVSVDVAGVDYEIGVVALG